MKRKFAIAAAVLMLLPLVAARGTAAQSTTPPPPTNPPVVFVTDFENEGAKLPWEARSDAATDFALERTTGDNGCTDGGSAYGALWSSGPAPGVPAATGPGRITAPARPGPVATWAEGGFPVDGGATLGVSVNWSATNVKNCEGCGAAVYVGDKPPTSGIDFTYAGTIGVAPTSSERWQQFQYEKKLGHMPSDYLYVALGWFGGEAVIGLDCINITVTQATPPSQEVGGGDFFYNFEGSLAPWSYDTDQGFGVLEADRGDNGCSNLDGYQFASVRRTPPGPSLMFFSADPLDYDSPAPHQPTTHMIAPFKATNAEVSHITLGWMEKNVLACGNCSTLLYVGDNPFPNAGEFKLLDTGFSEKWGYHGFAMDLAVKPLSQIYIGIGWKGPTGEEVDQPRDIGFDCVSVGIHPVPTGPSD